MKKIFNILAKILIIVFIVLLAITVLVIQVNSEKVPDAYAYTSSRNATCFRGNYTWYAFTNVMTETRYSKDTYVYKTDNTLLLSPQEKFTISNSQNTPTSRHKFEEKVFLLTNDEGDTFNVTFADTDYTYQAKTFIDILAPEIEGTYYYTFSLDYLEKGKVEYGLKVIVSSEQSYNIEDLKKYRNTSLVDVESINDIINILPYSRNKTNLIIQSTTTPTKLVINYSEIALDRSTFINNVLAMFVLIPEVDTIEYKSPELSYIYTRREIELKCGRHLSDYADDEKLWETEIMYGEKQTDENSALHNLFSSIVLSVIDFNSGERIDTVTINTKSFDENTFYDVDGLNRELILSDLSAKFNNIYDMSYDNYRAINQRHYYIEAEPISKYIPSGEQIVSITDISGDSNEAKTDDEIIQSYSGDNPLTLHKNEVYILVKRGNIEKRYHFMCYFIDKDKEWTFEREELNI